MADVVIGNREVIIDLSKLTIAEFRSLFDKEQKQEDEGRNHGAGMRLDG
jgi:hypothetical protein